MFGWKNYDWVGWRRAVVGWGGVGCDWCEEGGGCGEGLDCRGVVGVR